MIIKVKSFFIGHHITPSDRRLDEDRWNIPEGVTVAQVLEMLNLLVERAPIILKLNSFS